MADIGAIREGLRANLAAIPGCQVSAYMLSNATPPAFDVGPGETTYDITGSRGADRIEFVITGFVAATSDIGAQQTLDGWLAGSGSLSVKAAVEVRDAADGTRVTLGGSCDTARVMRATRPRQVVRADGTQLWMTEWTVEVYARGA